MNDPRLPYSRGRHADPVDGAPALLTEALVVAYPGAHGPALRGVSARVPCGTCTALVGPNGSGKSTLLKAVAGLLPVISGVVRVHGNPVGACHHRVAYLPQRGEIDWGVPISVEQLVLTGRYVHLGWLRRPGRRDRDIAGAAIDRLVLSTLAGQQIGKLSGRQQQGALLARALARRRTSSCWTSRSTAWTPGRRTRSATRCATCAAVARRSSSPPTTSAGSAGRLTGPSTSRAASWFRRPTPLPAASSRRRRRHGLVDRAVPVRLHAPRPAGGGCGRHHLRRAGRACRPAADGVHRGRPGPHHAAGAGGRPPVRLEPVARRTRGGTGDGSAHRLGVAAAGGQGGHRHRRRVHRHVRPRRAADEPDEVVPRPDAHAVRQRPGRDDRRPVVHRRRGGRRAAGPLRCSTRSWN